MILSIINDDLKKAMLSRNELEVTTLRGLKSAAQYAQVASIGKELSEDQITIVMQKEVKKRREAADLYEKAGSSEKQQREEAEIEIIERYLPEQMGEEQIQQLVDEVIASYDGSLEMSSMGQIIGQVKQKTGATADGSLIAKIVRSKLQQQ